MTLLFCDIVGSTALADRRDPEDTSATAAPLPRDVRGGRRQRYGGVIDDHQGDGMLVLFGYPQVGEDDVQRAVLCGWSWSGRSGSGRRATDPAAAALQLRVAVHTDLVVLDGIGVTGATAERGRAHPGSRRAGHGGDQ